MYQAKTGVKNFSLYWDRVPPLPLQKSETGYPSQNIWDWVPPQKSETRYPPKKKSETGYPLPKIWDWGPPHLDLDLGPPHLRPWLDRVPPLPEMWTDWNYYLPPSFGWRAVKTGCGTREMTETIVPTTSEICNIFSHKAHFVNVTSHQWINWIHAHKTPLWLTTHTEKMVHNVIAELIARLTTSGRRVLSISTKFQPPLQESGVTCHLSFSRYAFLSDYLTALKSHRTK